MEENEDKKFNFRVVMLVVSVVSFLAVLVSASFAFFSTTVSDTSGVSSIANANVALPMGCTFTALPSPNCSITGQTGSTVNYTDSIITTAEMDEKYKNNKVAESSCSINVVVNGNTGCKCDYTIKIEKTASSDDFVPASASVNEFTATLKRGTTVVMSESNINTLVGTNNNHTLSVSTTNSATSQLWNMTVKFYNIDSNQASTIAGKNYSYQLKAYATKCNGASLSSSTPTYTMLNSQGNVGQGAYGVFRSDADLSKLSSVQIDGETIPSSNYTTSSGSTIIRLKPEYTNTLSLGNHSIKIVSNDGYATSNFVVDNPVTFTIEEVGTFYASEGMTWADWIESYGISAGDNGIAWICYSDLCGSNKVGYLTAEIGNGLARNYILNPDNYENTLYTDIIINNGYYGLSGPV